MIRRVIFAALLLLLVIVGIRAIMRLLPRLQYNRAVYALNLHQYADAEQRFSQLAKREQDSAQVRTRLAEAMLRQGRADEAAAQLRSIRGFYPRGSYLLGIAEYMGQRSAHDEDRALASFTNFTSGSLEDLSASEQQMIQMALFALPDDLRPTGLSEPTAELPREELERMLFHSWKGRIAMREGRWGQARDLLQYAVKLEDSNVRTRVLACVATLLAGDYSEAQYYVDTSDHPVTMLDWVTTEVKIAISDRQTSAVAFQALTLQLRLREIQARAAAWIRLQMCRLNVPGETSNANGTTSDPIVSLLEGDLLAIQENYSTAFQAYNRAEVGIPSMQLMLRKHDITGNQAPPFEIVKAFTDTLPSATYIPALETTSSVPVSGNGVAQFRDAGQIAAGFSVPAAGKYSVTIIASSDHAANRGPLIQLQADTISAGHMYIAREGWDCYSLNLTLNAGAHQIKLEYPRDADTVSVQGEHRSLYIMGILIEPLPAVGN